jgi:trehalose/maltose hydrolase-like predicted phosphorylase
VSDPISPPPVTDYRPEFLPAYIANGVLGLRCGWVPFRIGTTIVNGFAGRDPADGVEGFSRVPFALGGDVELNGVRLSNAIQLVRFVEQRYDFASAELHTALDYTIDGASARIEVIDFCSHTIPSVVLQEIRVTVDRSADLALTVGLDPGKVPGRAELRPQPVGRATSDQPDGILIWHSPGELASCGIAYGSELLGDADAQRTTSPSDELGMVSTTYRIRARRNRPYRIRQFTALVPDLVHPHPAEQAGRLLALARQEGWDGVRTANRDAWRDLWRSRIEIEGASPRWQAITDASLFYLLTSVHPSSVAGTSLFGLAFWPNYHYYRGHVMWDIETFVVPPLSLIDPASARSILDYRARHLDAARQNAKMAGWQGAMFPWESCPLHGEEATPGASPPTKAHVSMDVALAFAAYAHATGDRDHLRRFLWPVIEAVAEFVASRVTRTRRGYEILKATGPAETDPPVDNNAFVNMAAAAALDAAVVFAGQLGEEPRPEWVEIAEALVLPRASNGRRIVNHDAYRVDEPKGGTPEAAAGIFPVGYPVPPDVERQTFRFAVEQQAPRYVGTPMLSGFLGLYAARAGDRDLAMELLERGYGDFVNEPYLETDEFSGVDPSKPRAGPMFANIGAYLTSLLFGFTGIRMGSGMPEEWPDRAVVMPSGWRAIRVERLRVRGEERSLVARMGARAELIRTPESTTRARAS